MYNRLNESPKAREYAQKALSGYQALGASSDEGQARFCLADALRVGSDADREQARQHADDAIATYMALGDSYNLARAYNYAATIAGLQTRRAESAALGEKALESARAAGNLVLQPLVLMNLGVTYNALGNRARAADYYRQSSSLYEALGNQARAAETEMNRGALLIEFGPDPGEGVREVRNALAVMRKLGNKDFEALCLQMIGWYERNVGRAAEAERTVNQGLAVAREHDLHDRAARLTISLARVRLATGDYFVARQLLTEDLLTGVSKGIAVEAALLHARAAVRLGDFDTARRDLGRALPQLQGADETLGALLETVTGELEYESGHSEQARSRFARAAAFWTDDVPDEASVEARAYLGLLDAINGRWADGRRSVQASLDHSRKNGCLLLEERCRSFLARIDVRQGRFQDALETLRTIPDDSSQQTIGPELRAQAQYWQMQALSGLGNHGGAESAERAARESLEKLRSTLPAQYRTSFGDRPDIRRILG